MNRHLIGHRHLFSTDSTPPVGKHTVKICLLCGTLNHETNAECWTCRWHGSFSRDAHTIEMAWKRLEALYEDVRLEHVTSHRMRELGDFGAVRPATRWQAAVQVLRAWWERFQTRRDLHSAQREARLRSRHRSRPDGLGSKTLSGPAAASRERENTSGQ